MSVRNPNTACMSRGGPTLCPFATKRDSSCPRAPRVPRRVNGAQVTLPPTRLAPSNVKMICAALLCALVPTCVLWLDSRC